jgi:peptide/nickel transport system permease protein
MFRFLFKRLLVALPILFLVATFTFFLVQMVPGDPASFLLGGSASAAQVKELDAQLGLDRPVLAQYVSWLGDVAHGDLGESFVSNQPVGQSLSGAVPATLSVALGATLLTLAVGVPLGIACAVRGGRLDRAVRAACGLTMAVPNFWLAALLVFVFAVRLRLFPATGYVALGDSPTGWLEHLVLPVVAIAVAGLGQVVFQTRASVLDTLALPYVRTLQSAGVPRRRILYKHVLRNAAIPVATVTGLSFVFVLGGVVVIEAIFNLNGLGSLMLSSVQTHDLALVQGAVLYFSLVVIIVNLTVDLVTAWLDPRVRVS